MIAVEERSFLKWFNFEDEKSSRKGVR